MSLHTKKTSDIRQGMRISVIEGCFAQIFSTLTSIGSAFITKAAVLLNAGPMQFSLLSAISQLSLFFQLYAVKHSQDKDSRKSACVWFAFFGRLVTILLGVSVAFVGEQAGMYFFLCVLMLSATLQTISHNMWLAWMSDLIPKRIMGRFLSFRLQIHLILGLVVGYFFSFMIDLYGISGDGWRYRLLERLNLLGVFSAENLKYGLLIVFVCGAILGMYGLLGLNRQPEMAIKKADGEGFSLWEPLRNSDFRKLLRFGLWWMFAIGIGSAFWQPYMLQELKMSMVEIQVYSMLSSLAMVVSYRFWGMFVDRFGNKTAMKIVVFLGFINPCLWLFMTKSNYVLIWFEGVTSGMMWSGANLIAVNFVLAIAPRGREQQWSAVYSALCGLMMLSTILLSGLFYPPYVNILGVRLHPMQVLFGLTGVLRLSAEIPLFMVNEPKAVGLRKTVGMATAMVIGRMNRFRDRWVRG